MAMNFLGALFCVSKATFTFIEIAAGLSGEAGVDVVLALGRFFEVRRKDNGRRRFSQWKRSDCLGNEAVGLQQ